MCFRKRCLLDTFQNVQNVTGFQTKKHYGNVIAVIHGIHFKHMENVLNAKNNGQQHNVWTVKNGRPTTIGIKDNLSANEILNISYCFFLIF